MSEAARHWDDWQREHAAAPGAFVDWGDHPRVLALVYEEVFGSATRNFFDFFKEHYPSFAQATALSLCCGDGAFEKLLVSQDVFARVIGTDLSPVRVAAANRQRGEFEERLDYQVHDVNEGDFGEEVVDVVFAKAALHHVEALEAMFAGVRRCLRPGGRLVTIDFFGPTRFQWTDTQLAAVNRFLANEVPQELLRKPDGSLHRNVERPTIESMIAMDPSEAVRSSELHEQLASNLQIEREIALGGTLLNLILDGSVVNNFDPRNADHNRIIEKAFALERSMMAAGEIESDFRLIVAR
jgi:SAM-dependent methyltransferase